MSFYGFLKKCLHGIIKLFYRLRAEGVENEPKEGAFIVCANHISNTDPISIGMCMKTNIRFMAKAELFKIPLVRHFFRAMGAYPVKRGTADVSAMKHTLKMLENGESIGLFPQGKRYMKVDPRTTEPKPGIGMIAYRSGCPVLPVFIEVKGNKHRIFKRHTVRFGKLITQDELAFSGGTKSEYERAAKLIFDRILELSPEARAEKDGKK